MLSCNKIHVSQGAPSIHQFTDSSITSEEHTQCLAFQSGSASYSSTLLSIDDMGNTELEEVPVHNEVLVWDDTSLWTNKTFTSLLQQLRTIIDGIITITNSKYIGNQGHPALTDMVMFTDTLTSGYTMGLASCGDGNIILKREPTDTDFTYLTTLDMGQNMNFNLPAGTVFRSLKGISGFSAPFPMPLGLSSLSSTYFTFYAFRLTSTIFATSAGLESTVFLYDSSGTVADGPTTIAPFGTATLHCGDDVQGEFKVVASTNVYCGTRSYNTIRSTDMRLVIPCEMSCEVMVWNRFCRVIAQELNTTVRWYRRNGDTGSFTVHAGTPVNIYTGNINEDEGVSTPNNAGGTADYKPDGCLILKSDKPISAFSGADSNGWEATPGWPLIQMAQVFANPATINNSTDAGIASVSLGSQYEGEFQVFDSSKTLIATAPITRTNSVTTTEDQLYPAAGQWQPVNSGLSTFTGGYIIANVPAICIMNLNGSSAPWTADEGDELMIPGVTPDEIRACIKVDQNGFYRRRDIDSSGTETWTIC
ncbi:FirrV-1-C3 [Feldmannia irregularis virus a]|uniref:FirrV-1-C3 n=1 Tax=Feldmannia irregularis virus a TaxID=231992 RepID=Q6XLX5_9PHYC|nr:FirrV-1-C3 [Feldmannia irregularis virus a]AAR26936.1 FirrV-1-C3 [Feldmannia irregularis virus a]